VCKKLFGNSKKNFKQIFLIIVLISGILLSISLVFENFFSTTINFFTITINQTFYNFSTNISKIFQNFSANIELTEEIETLKKNNRDLRNLIVDYYDIKKENEQLIKTFKIKEENKNLVFVGASVVSCSAAENFYSFIINRGKNSGISTNDIVVAENGLVGKISNVTNISSRVTTVLSPDFKICGIDKFSDDIGIISGNIELCRGNLVQMTLIPAQNEIKVDDIIVTAGFNGIYPKNLQIGKIFSVEHNVTENSKFAIIKLFENIKNIKDVFVITDFHGKGEV
jgi:rod shape-determining protein MreC